ATHRTAPRLIVDAGDPDKHQSDHHRMSNRHYGLASVTGGYEFQRLHHPMLCVAQPLTKGTYRAARGCLVKGECLRVEHHGFFGCHSLPSAIVDVSQAMKYPEVGYETLIGDDLGSGDCPA